MTSRDVTHIIIRRCAIDEKLFLATDHWPAQLLLGAGPISLTTATTIGISANNSTLLFRVYNLIPPLPKTFGAGPDEL